MAQQTATDFEKDRQTGEITANAEPGKIDENAIEGLGFRLWSKFTLNQALRWWKEQEWLKCLRQFKGVYDPEIESKLHKKRSKVYPKLTRSKCISVRSRLHEIAFPDIGKSWSVSPSPEPEVGPEVIQKITEFLTAQAQAIYQEQVRQAEQNKQRPPQGPQPITEELMDRAIERYAKEACAKMENEIADQLLDTGYEAKTKLALRSGLIFGTGIIKGPMVETTSKVEWKVDPITKQFAPSRVEVHKPYLEYVRVWDWYPDMTATEHGDSDGDFERHIMTKHDVRRLANRKGFDKEKIYEYLTTNPTGDATFRDWEIQLQTLSTDEGELKKGRRYEVLEFWGHVDARDLAEAGVNIPEERQDIEFYANVWLLGKNVIYADLNPMPADDNPYHLFYFEKDESSIFGQGLPWIMRDSQLTVCAAARMMLDNAAITAGPQIEWNTTIGDPTQDIDDIFPFKVWTREGQNQEANYPALRIYNITSYTAEYATIIKQFIDFSDLETAFPTYMLIEPEKVGNETAQGASLRHGTVNITVKDIARQIDILQAGIIEGMYNWNMDFNPKEEIKGDYKVQAKGLSSLVAKEVRAQQMQGVNTSLTDQQRTWVKEDEFMKEYWKTVDLPHEILRSEAEHQQYIQDTTDPRVIELQVQKLAAEVAKLQAGSLNMTAMAKEKNIRAGKEAAKVNLEE
jgi:hypothetical protein